MPLNIPNIGSAEAARYLEIPYNDFISYVNQGLICYYLRDGTISSNTERYFTRSELHRFKIEVLDRKGKL